MAKRFEFSYPYASYMDVSLMRETKKKKELLAEYRAMQKEANRRLNQLSKYKWTEASQAYQYNKDRFKGGTSRMTKADLAKQMRDAAIFLSSQTSTLQGQRRARNRMLDTFREEYGLSFVNRNNIAHFARFLAAARTYFGAGHYNMDEIEALFRVAKKEKMDISKIEESFTSFLGQAQESRYYDRFMSESTKFSSEDYDRNPL